MIEHIRLPLRSFEMKFFSYSYETNGKKKLNFANASLIHLFPNRNTNFLPHAACELLWKFKRKQERVNLKKNYRFILILSSSFSSSYSLARFIKLFVILQICTRQHTFLVIIRFVVLSQSYFFVSTSYFF